MIRKGMLTRFGSLFSYVKKLHNDWSYSQGMTKIMSDAMEYGIDPDIVDKQLEANYKNHYCK